MTAGWRSEHCMVVRSSECAWFCDYCMVLCQMFCSVVQFRGHLWYRKRCSMLLTIEYFCKNFVTVPYPSYVMVTAVVLLWLLCMWNCCIWFHDHCWFYHDGCMVPWSLCVSMTPVRFWDHFVMWYHDRSVVVWPLYICTVSSPSYSAMTTEHPLDAGLLNGLQRQRSHLRHGRQGGRLL